MNAGREDAAFWRSGTSPASSACGPVGSPRPSAGDYLDAACALAGDLSPAARAALAAAWPADAPHPAVVAHLLAVMLADVAAAADAEVSKGFIRAGHQEQRRPPKARPPSLGLASELEPPKKPAPNAG